MALKSFFVRAQASGRATPIVGGPRVSKKHSSMSVDYYQADRGDPYQLVKIESEQNKRSCRTIVTVYVPGEEPIQHEIETKL